jgi:ectoine hydroxylase-related dioxygenase (phytanoyl-CoA dioxygenase family)
MLTAAQLERYRRDGYVIPDFRLPEPVLADIRSDHARLIERHPELRQYCPNLLAYDLRFLELARTPEILEMVRQILGDDFALWNSSFFAKPAQDGQRTPWHQDGQYWPIRPLATCTAWIAIDNSTTENGCLRVIPGSQRERRLRAHRKIDATDVTLNQELLAEEYDETQAADIVLEAGQMSLHDIYLLHGSEPNRSPRARRGMTLRYMPTSSHFDRSIARQQAAEFGITDHSVRTLYLMSGADRCGKNDFRVRR